MATAITDYELATTKIKEGKKNSEMQSHVLSCISIQIQILQTQQYFIVTKVHFTIIGLVFG